MVKRELKLSDDGDISSDESLKPVKKSPKKEKECKPKKTQKTQWSPEEDEILVGMIEQVIKEHIWEKVKNDGRLVERTSYGCQYHANMLLRQGTGKAAPKGSPKK